MFGGVRLTRQMSIRGYRVWSIDSLLLCRPQVCCELKECGETGLARVGDLVGSVVCGGARRSLLGGPPAGGGSLL